MTDIHEDQNEVKTNYKKGDVVMCIDHSWGHYMEIGDIGIICEVDTVEDEWHTCTVASDCGEYNDDSCITWRIRSDCLYPIGVL